MRNKKVSFNQMKQEERIPCLLCGHEALLERREIKGYKEPDLFKIYACPHCNTNFSMPRPEADSIYRLIYKNPADVPGYDIYWRLYQDIKKEKRPLRFLASRNRTYWSIYYTLRKIIRHNKKSPIIFEIGSGLGYLTYALRRAGYNATGLDISEEAIKKAISDFGDYYVCADIMQYVQEHIGGVDIVILTEVIEHIKDPITFLRAIRSLLKDRGYIILTTPNKSYAPSSLVWATDHPPVHFWWFSEDSITFIARQLDLNVEFVDFSKCYMERMHPSHPPTSDIEDKYIFSVDGHPFEYANHTPRYGILPRWFKKTECYKAFSHNFYPWLSFFWKKTPRCGTLCAVLTKREA